MVPKKKCPCKYFKFGHVLPCNTNEMGPCVPEQLSCIHHNHEEPNSAGKKQREKSAAEPGGSSYARRFLGGVFAQRAHSASYYGVPYLNIGTSAG